MIQSGEFQATAVVISRLSMVVADSFLETSMIEEGFPMNGVAQQTGIDTTPTAVPGVLIYKEFFRLIRVTLAKNILKNHSHKNKRAGIAVDVQEISRCCLS